MEAGAAAGHGSTMHAPAATASRAVGRRRAATGTCITCRHSMRSMGVGSGITFVVRASAQAPHDAAGPPRRPAAPVACRARARRCRHAAGTSAAQCQHPRPQPCAAIGGVWSSWRRRVDVNHQPSRCCSARSPRWPSSASRMPRPLHHAYAAHGPARAATPRAPAQRNANTPDRSHALQSGVSGLRGGGGWVRTISPRGAVPPGRHVGPAAPVACRARARRCRHAAGTSAAQCQHPRPQPYAAIGGVWSSW